MIKMMINDKRVAMATTMMLMTRTTMVMMILTVSYNSDKNDDQ